MPHWRRAYIPGGTFFFTLVTNQRAPVFKFSRARRIFGAVLRECRSRWPLAINAIVLLPDHLHMIWSLPSGDTNYSRRLGWMKKEFSKSWLQSGGLRRNISAARRGERLNSIW